MTTALVTTKGKTSLARRRRLSSATASDPKEDKKKKRRRRRRKSTKGKGKLTWFSPKTKSGWSKLQPANIRRRLLLKAHRGKLLSAARSKQALANVTPDEDTRVLALSDARHFFELYRKSKKKKK